MMVKIIIERRVIPECVKEYEKRALQIQQLVFYAAGFVASEAFYGFNNTNHRYVIVTFDNAHNWNQWYKSDQRREAVSELLHMLEEPEKVTIMEAIIRT